MRLRRWAVLGFGLAAACASTIGPVTPTVEALVVLDSLDDSLRIMPVDSPGIVHTLALHVGGPVSALALRGSLAAIAIGRTVEVLDLGTHVPVCGPTDLGAGATITALAFDSTGQGYAAAPGNSKVGSFTTSQSSSCLSRTDGYSGAPQGFGTARGSIYVVIGKPGTGPCVPTAGGPCASWLTSYPPSQDSIPLLGPGNARTAVFASDGFLYVVNAGSGSNPDGSLSQIDPLQKSGIGGPTYPGFGRLPSYLATDNADRLFVTSPVDSGLMVFNVRNHQVEKGYTSSVALGDASRGIAVDDLGRIYVLLAGSCNSNGLHGSIHLLGQDLVATRDVPVGRCPIAIGITEISAELYHFD